MMLSEQEAENIKKQIISQIDSTFPDDKKEAVKSQIMSMDNVQLEEFLEKNNLKQKEQPQCIFCSIASGETEAVKIDEDSNAFAALEINPVSKGHAIIIPKNHISEEKDIPESAIEMAKKISEKMKKLSPKNIEVVPSNLFGHQILNILPVYNGENLNSKRHPAGKDELEEVQKVLSSQEKKVRKTQKKQKTSKIRGKLWLPRRIP